MLLKIVFTFSIWDQNFFYNMRNTPPLPIRSLPNLLRYCYRVENMNYKRSQEHFFSFPILPSLPLSCLSISPQNFIQYFQLIERINLGR